MQGNILFSSGLFVVKLLLWLFVHTIILMLRFFSAGVLAHGFAMVHWSRHRL